MTTRSRILVLGGTSWLGGLFTRLALARGHHVTCLARGESGPVPRGARWVEADRWREGAYDEVRQESWDAVLEVAWQPELVASAVRALARQAQRWVYVSSLSAYADHTTPGLDEDAPLLPAWHEPGVVGIENYGEAKVSCETSCREGVPPERLLVIRSGLIVGYGDTSDRFGYWPARAADSEEPRSRHILVPPLDLPVEVLDVRDLSQWLLDCIESPRSGTFNATGDALTFDAVIRTCAVVAARELRLVEAPGSWLEAHKVNPWGGPDSLPLWLPQPEWNGLGTFRNDRAKAAGLVLRPLTDTVTDSLRWERELGLRRQRAAGLSPSRELQLVSSLLAAMD